MDKTYSLLAQIEELKKLFQSEEGLLVKSVPMVVRGLQRAGSYIPCPLSRFDYLHSQQDGQSGVSGQSGPQEQSGHSQQSIVSHLLLVTTGRLLYT